LANESANIIVASGHKDTSSYLAAKQQLQDEPEKIDSKRSQLYSTRLLQEYIRNGKILSTKETYEFHGEIGGLMNEYILEKTSEHLRKSSIHTYQLQLSRFLHYLSDKGKTLFWIYQIYRRFFYNNHAKLIRMRHS
jgi:hypothetical protein